MSYAPFGPKSDIYVYNHVGGFIDCCGCLLKSDGDFHSVEAIVAHMHEHVAAGHQVYPELLDPATFARANFIGMCDIFLCREDKGHDGDHTPLSGRFPNGRDIRARQLAAALPGTDKENN